MSDEQLRKNVESQLERLLSQLEDLEENKADFDDDEYESMKADTREQLKEFQATLEQMTAGNMTLLSELESTRQAVRAAISDAFKTPEVIRLFAGKKPAMLRQRLAQIDEDVRLGKMDKETMGEQVAEILVALKKLKEPLAPKEERFLQQHKSASLSEFEAVEDSGETVTRLPTGPS